MAATDFQRLDPRLVRDTLDRLHERITARFPDRNLAQVALSVRQVIDEVVTEFAVRRRRQRTVRAVCTAAIVGVVALALVAVGLSVRDAVDQAEGTPAFEWLPVVESGINDLVFAGIAVFFLATVPARQRRHRALGSLHRLRSLAHVIDMHQLTKDPDRLRLDVEPTEASAPTDLSASELGRYLDYCSELLSIVGKTAALCAQESTDAVVLDTVSEIESLTVGMSRKIWQKISILQAMIAPGRPPLRITRRAAAGVSNRDDGNREGRRCTRCGTGSSRRARCTSMARWSACTSTATLPAGRSSRCTGCRPAVPASGGRTTQRSSAGCGSSPPTGRGWDAARR